MTSQFVQLCNKNSSIFSGSHFSVIYKTKLEVISSNYDFLYSIIPLVLVF